MAVLAGVLHAGASSVLSIGDVKPNLVFIVLAVVVVLSGPLRAAWWAFWAGMAIDATAGSALGSTSLVLLVAGAGLSTLSAALGGLRAAFAPAAVLLAAIAAEVLPLTARGVGGVANAGSSFWIVLVSALLSAAAAGVVVLVLAVRAGRRQRAAAASTA